MTADSAPTRAHLREVIESEFGTPFDVLELRCAGESAELPSEMDVLCFEPRPEEQLESEWFVYLLTCGVGVHVLDGPTPRFELLVSVRRRISAGERQQLARRLLELATMLFRNRFALPPELVLANLSLPLFERMSHLVLSAYLGQEHLPSYPPVAVVKVTPVFAREAEQIRRLGVAEAFYRFGRAGVREDDPARGEIDLEGIATPPSGKD